MKRTIVSISVLLGIVFLAGCSPQSTSQIQQPTINNETTHSEELAYISNDKYGFSLVLPYEWKDYKMVETKKGIDGYPVVTSFEVSLNDVKFFTISVYTKEEFAKLEKQHPNGVPFTYNYKAAENASYVFTAYGSQDAETSIYPISKDVPNFLKTFFLVGIKDPTEPLSYTIIGDPVSVSKKTASFNYTAKQLKGMADECGTKYDVGNFDRLVSNYSGTTKTIYNFKYTGVSQEADTFVVTLLPNLAGYRTMNEFKLDFDLCYAGGDAYPKMLNSNWLLFVNACGSGYYDGSGGPAHGCDEAQKVVEPTLGLN